MTSTTSDSGRYEIADEITRNKLVTVVILFFVNLINYMDRYTVAAVLMEVKLHFHLTADMGGLLQTVFVFSYMVFAPLFGYLGDRYSRRLVMAAGISLWTAATLAGSFTTHNYWWFLLFRALVGTGEAGYSAIAPPVVSDLFVHDSRSRVLAFFFFAIPVGSGLGYIVGSEACRLTGSWQNALRVTPVLGVVAVLLIVFVIVEPERGASEGRTHLTTMSWTHDLKLLWGNPSFLLSTAGLTCLCFVGGALAWWGPYFVLLGHKMQPDSEHSTMPDVSTDFGVITMISGALGVPLGTYVACKLRTRFPRADPLVCAVGILLSSPVFFAASFYASTDTVVCFILMFVGSLLLNLNWAIIADMLLYVVAPPRRSTASAVQLLVSHLLGDAGSPYLVGLVAKTLHSAHSEFLSLQYALFLTNFVGLLGGLAFLLTAIWIVQDKEKADNEVNMGEVS